MKFVRSLFNLRQPSAARSAPSQAPDDTALELKAHVYRRVNPQHMRAPSRVVSVRMCEMTLPSDTKGFGYDFYDAVRGIGRLSQRAVKFGRQDTTDLCTEIHALKTVLLRPAESFVRFISEGGSGAKPYVVRLANGDEVLRKLMLSGSFKKQDAEAKGEEVIRGYSAGLAQEGMDAWRAGQDPRVQHVLQDPAKVSLLQSFIRETRPHYFSRYVATLPGPSKDRLFASFFDQEFVDGCEFAKAISHDGVPLTSAQLDALVRAQLDVLATFYDYQAKIYQEPVRTDQDRQEAVDYYLVRLQSRVLGPLAAGEFDEVLLHLPETMTPSRQVSDVSCDLTDHAAKQRFSLGALFRQPTVTINGQIYPNPIPELQDYLMQTSSPLLGWSMHGDPQQTNFLLTTPLSPQKTVDPPAVAKLLCIDNRPAQITPYTADLEKVLWGAGWVPVFQGDVVARLISQPQSKQLCFRLEPKPGAEGAVKNFQEFEHRLRQALAVRPWFRQLVENDKTLDARIALSAVNQCLCDIGIAVTRLHQARQAIVADGPDLDLPGTQNLIQLLTERIVGDFLLSCQYFSHYRATYLAEGVNDSPVSLG